MCSFGIMHVCTDVFMHYIYMFNIILGVIVHLVKCFYICNQTVQFSCMFIFQCMYMCNCVLVFSPSAQWIDERDSICALHVSFLCVNINQLWISRQWHSTVVVASQHMQLYLIPCPGRLAVCILWCVWVCVFEFYVVVFWFVPTF